MYASHGFLRSDIGDVDVLFHDGVFHLFHLVLPNHDFIAHAVSQDGLNWRRVKNALFVGEPGSWDDDMLWTMHVTADPDRPGQWRMFYTGLARRGVRPGPARGPGALLGPGPLGAGRIGLFPLQIAGDHYETSIDEGRKWVSFRDPFFYYDPKSQRRMLLASGRVDHGPLVRRGCVAVAHEVSPGEFEFDAPLHRPGIYDDVEVPNLCQIGGRYYLLGSIREDTKVHYWYSDTVDGPYLNFFDNVVLPRGNYAGRVCRWEIDGQEQWLLYNFFAKQETHYGRDISKKLLPPPKLMVTDETGRLRLKSYPGFDALVCEDCDVPAADTMDRLFQNPRGTASGDRTEMHLECESGYEAFLLPGSYESFRLRASVGLEGSGKCGMVLRVDEEGNGYYLSLDLFKGVAQLRAWGVRDNADLEHSFDYQQLQAGYFVSRTEGPWDIEVVAHGMYLEVSIGGYVTLSLVDDSYCEGRMGFYSESAKVVVQDLDVQRLEPADAGAAHRADLHLGDETADARVGRARPIDPGAADVTWPATSKANPAAGWLLISDVDDTLTGDDAALATLAEALGQRRPRLTVALNSSRPAASVDATLASVFPRSFRHDAIITAMGTQVRVGGAMVDAWTRRFAGWPRQRIVDVVTGLGHGLHDEEYQTPHKASFAVPRGARRTRCARRWRKPSCPAASSPRAATTWTCCRRAGARTTRRCFWPVTWGSIRPPAWWWRGTRPTTWRCSRSPPGRSRWATPGQNCSKPCPPPPATGPSPPPPAGCWRGWSTTACGTRHKSKRVR